MKEIALKMQRKQTLLLLFFFLQFHRKGSQNSCCKTDYCVFESLFLASTRNSRNNFFFPLTRCKKEETTRFLKNVNTSPLSDVYFTFQRKNPSIEKTPRHIDMDATFYLKRQKLFVLRHSLAMYVRIYMLPYFYF